jgi:hypothetical protein
MLKHDVIFHNNFCFIQIYNIEGPSLYCQNLDAISFIKDEGSEHYIAENVQLDPNIIKYLKENDLCEYVMEYTTDYHIKYNLKLTSSCLLKLI